MRRTVLATATVLLAATVTALPAGSATAASTTIGEASAAPTPAGAGAGGAGYSVFQDTTSAGGPSYAVPAGGGVVTRWSLALRGATTAPTRVALLVGRAEVGGYVLDGVDPQSVAAQGASTLVSFSGVRVPVNEGSRLGVWSAGAKVVSRTAPGAVIVSNGSPDTSRPPATGGAVPTDTVQTQRGELAQISATVEPDADHDGWGDDTQDACPTEPAAHLAPCPAHVSTSAQVGPESVGTGGGVSVTTTITVTGRVPATDLTITSASTPGLSLLAARSSKGSCASATSCHLGEVAPGASVIVVQDVVALRPGLQSVTATLGGGSQPLLDDTSLTTLVNVELSPAATKVAVCRVPILVGKTVGKAKAALARAGCRAGFVTVPHLRAGQRPGDLRVRAQGTSAGRVTARGAKVAMVLAVPSRKVSRRTAANGTTTTCYADGSCTATGAAGR